MSRHGFAPPATCPECGRTFDIGGPVDLDDHYRDECDAQAVEVVEVDSDRGEVHAEAWAWSLDAGMGMCSGQHAYTQEGPGALPRAIGRAFDGGAVFVVVRPLMGNYRDLQGMEVAT